MASKTTRWLPLTLMVGFGITSAATWLVASREVANHRLQFQQRIDNLATALQRNLNRYTEVLLAMGDFYQVAELRVSPEEFARFVARALDTYPGIQALEWAPFVPDATRDLFEREMQTLGISGFRITERSFDGQLSRAARRPYYVPVTYVQPLAGNEVAVGFDLASDLTRRQALETARQTRQIVASARIRLVQEPADQFGFLVFLPLYGSQLNGDLFQGYLLGVFRVSDVVQEALTDLSVDIDFDLYDQTASAAQQYLGHYDADTKRVQVDRERQDPVSWHQSYLCPQSCTQTLEVAGREWRVQFQTPADRWIMPVAAIATLMMGAALTLMIFEYLRRAQTELVQARQLSDLKQKIFAMASHELRTPLSTILISAQSLESNRLSPDQLSKIYGRIRSSAKLMTQLLNDLLTLNRAEAGKLAFSPELVNLTVLCNQWIEAVQSSLEDPHDIDICLDQACQKVFVDPKLIQSIVVNLVSNALKYSPQKGSILFSLTCDQTHIWIKIRDQGIGIPESDQAHLFNTFYRGSNVGDIPGTGLGLAVVQTCAFLHQGTIAFESSLGSGTTFIVTIPRVD
ncbi:MAG: histidine kinase [Synechococcaceae cyanobacterium SM2_3_2]|nr:histidine kinase [Synechococcaceae cyanobacterium SM2_3_2]